MDRRMRRATDPEVVESTAGLVRFMLDLVRTTRRRVRDSDGYPGRVWLVDLPAGVGPPSASEDGVLLRIPYEPRKPPPLPPRTLAAWLDRSQVDDAHAEPELAGREPGQVVPDVDALLDYSSWLPVWQRWAEAERAAAPRRALYRKLTGFARELARHDDTMEAVLAVGLLTWRTRAGIVRRHLVTHRVSVALDRTTARITVALDPDGSPRLEDRDFLDASDGFAEQRVAPLREGMDVGPRHPLDPAMTELLRVWRERALDEQSVRWRDDWTYPAAAEEAPWLTVSPALILRVRERNALLEHYARMAAELSHADAAAPLGLAQLVCALEPAERLAWADATGAEPGGAGADGAGGMGTGGTRAGGVGGTDAAGTSGMGAGGVGSGIPGTDAGITSGTATGSANVGGADAAGIGAASVDGVGGAPVGAVRMGGVGSAPADVARGGMANGDGAAGDSDATADPVGRADAAPDSGTTLKTAGRVDAASSATDGTVGSVDGSYAAAGGSVIAERAEPDGNYAASGTGASGDGSADGSHATDGSGAASTSAAAAEGNGVAGASHVASGAGADDVVGGSQVGADPGSNGVMDAFGAADVANAADPSDGSGATTGGSVSGGSGAGAGARAAAGASTSGSDAAAGVSAASGARAAADVDGAAGEYAAAGIDAPAGARAAAGIEAVAAVGSAPGVGTSAGFGAVAGGFGGGGGHGAAESLLGDDPLFPLPTNPAQRDVLKRLQHDTAVVVQGPPGTGKTHTIANLTAALLASGQRVLITSQKDQALKVLREKIPPRLRDMCVLLADVRHGGSSELDRSIRALSDRVTSTSPERLEAEIESLRARRASLRSELARREELIRQVREAETYEHPEIAAGFAGTLADIAERVNELRAAYDWLPPLPDGVPDLPPLDVAELVELRALILTTADDPEGDRWLPDPAPLPTAERFAALAAAATTPRSEPAGSLTERLSALARIRRPAPDPQRAAEGTTARRTSTPTTPPTPPAGRVTPDGHHTAEGTITRHTGTPAEWAAPHPGGATPDAQRAAEGTHVRDSSTPAEWAALHPGTAALDARHTDESARARDSGTSAEWAARPLGGIGAGPDMTRREGNAGSRGAAEPWLPGGAVPSEGWPGSTTHSSGVPETKPAGGGARARDVGAGAARRLGEGALGIDVLGGVRGRVSAGADALHRMGVGDRSVGWDPGDWRTGALGDRLARKNGLLWAEALATGDEALLALAALNQPGLPHVDVPSDLDMPRTAALVHSGERLIGFLNGGGRLRGRFASAEQRQAQELLDGCRVSGHAPESAHDVAAVVTILRAHYSTMRLADQWAQAGVETGAGTTRQRLARVLDDVEALGHVMAFGTARDAVDALLMAHGLRVPLNRPAEWDALADAVDAAAALVAADRAADEIDAVTAQVFAEPAGRPAPEADAVRQALRSRDAAAYEDAITDLLDAHARRANARRRDDLHARLAAAHPVFARRLAETAQDPTWERRLGELPSAWAWAVATRFCELQRDPGRGQRLDRELAAAEADLQQVTEALAAASGWWHCLSRMTQEQRQALQAYRSAIAQAGKGTGRYAGRHLASARDAMRVARRAVPAWVMPLAQVAETIPPEPNCFDVVIVDEASQASVDAAFLLYLAPRVIVVGDDRQCVPGTMWLGELQPIYDKLDDYLPDLPHWMRNGFRPQSNLYELLSERFPEVIRLSEHFRCMPEIIGWSSEQFYDGRLTPLRQFGADRLEPLRVVAVEGAYTEGEQQKLRNEVEAKHLVETLRALLDDPAYAERSIGVIALQSPAQRLLLEKLIDDSIEQTLIERHGIRVGLAPDFQGDERDVIMISMVVAGSPRAYTSRDDQRRFNVAASRARDQLWLFSSVTVSDLRPTDLRYSLLTYMRSPRAADALPPMPRPADVEPDVRHPAFESLFEQRVFRRIAERGFHVTPQYPVENRRIDLVVIGDDRRLAIECDGRHWHGTPEQRLADMARERELKRVGWTFWRVTDSEFTLDPDHALAPLWAELDRLGITPRVDDVPEPEAAEDEAEPPADEWHPIELPDEDEAEV